MAAELHRAGPKRTTHDHLRQHQTLPARSLAGHPGAHDVVIFPRAWCEQQGIAAKDYDTIINKTPICYKANRKIGGDAPSRYLQRIQDDPQVQASDEAMNAILDSHCIPAARLREDDFHGFIADRKRRLLSLIETVMGKRIADPDAA